MKKYFWVIVISMAGFFYPIFGAENALGSYGGDFRAEEYNEGKKPTFSNKITIWIEKLENNKIYGKSIAAGNLRPFQGTYTLEKDLTIKATAKEPGDDKYDGVFTFQLIPGKKIIGIWKSYKTNLAVTKRSYSLEFFKFKYDPNQILSENVSWVQLYNPTQDGNNEGETLTDDVIKYNPSSVLLKKENIENMYKGDLEVMRNSIYARHGYSFKNRKMRYIFDTYFPWYYPISLDIRKELTDLEKKNEDLIKRYEKHANEYYDSYGR